jgi:adenine-specific DNA-methyltransferase
MTYSTKEKDLLNRISQLEKEIKLVKKQKKYGLVWEDKPEQIVEDCKRNVPILRLKEKKKGIDPVVTTDKSKDENLLIEGDNYHALSVLNYTHKGKIDVIYIDPPYNTGARDWKYNNDYVDINDQWRHSKWVSFMNNRLWLAKNLLSKDGVLIIAIDHNEQEALGILLQEIFADKEIDPIVIIHNPAGVQGKNFSYTHEFAYFVYPKNGKYIGEVSRDKELVSPLRDWGGTSARKLAKTCFYPIIVKDGEIIGFGDVCAEDFHPKSANIKQKDGSIFVYPIDDHGVERKWVYSKSSAEKNLHQLFVKERNGEFVIIRRKDSFTYRTVWDDKKYYANIFGSKTLNNIIPTKFSFPKSLYTVEDCIKAVVHNKDKAIILDFFAGSGTTGHAVLELNKQDSGNRKFILCTNNENNICEEITYERIKRVMTGYTSIKGEKVEGLGGNLRYYKTDLVDIEKLHHTPDQAKVKLTYQAGEMVGLRENTLNEVAKNDWWQIFEGHGKTTAIYFKEDKEKLQDLVDLLEKKKQSAVLYIFSWGKNEYKSEYSSANIRVEDIPEPILEVYKEINRL